MIEWDFMEHLILFAYILIFSTGFAALAALFLLKLRMKSPFLGTLIGVQSLFIAALAIVAVYFYLGNVMDLVGHGSNAIERGFDVVSCLVNSSLYLFLARTVGFLPDKPDRNRLRIRIVQYLCYASIGTMVVRLIISLIPAFDAAFNSSQALLLSWRILNYLLVAVTIGSFGFILVRIPTPNEHSAVQFLLKGLGICSLGYVPLGILEFVLYSSLDQLYYPLSLEYLFYMGNNVVMIIAAVRSLQTTKDTAPAFKTLKNDTGARFALTQREQEMVGLIARGLSNKEIAGELNISVATVRTHIYNLFQKVGAQSRIELLNILST